MSVAFGLDFGTSNSSLSVNDSGNITLLNIDKNNPIALTLKSVLFFCKEGKETKAYVGYEAVEKYIENEGEGRYMQSIKSFLPDNSFDKTEIFYKNYSLVQLVAFILKKIKDRGEEIVGKNVDDVVLGRPVFFSEDSEREKLARERLVESAKIAGFKNIQLQLEPIAAALSYENRLKNGEEKIVLVGDFGAGTSDFTILKANKNSLLKTNRIGDILSTGGVYIGGDIFDSDIMWEKVCNYYGKNVEVKSMMSDNRFGLSSIILSKLKRWHLIPLLRSMTTMQSIKEFKYLASYEDKKLIENLENLINLNYGYLLFQSIEQAKCELSSSNDSKIHFNDYNIFIEEKITRQEFESFIRDKVMQIDNCIEKLISDAGLSNNNIDVVFLTGGSSFIPVIINTFEKKFGKDKLIQSDAFTSVSFGLGLTSSIYF